MPVQLGADIKLVQDVGGEEVAHYFPPYDDADFMEGQRRLLGGRIRQVRGGRGGIKDESTEARERFYDKWCSRVEGVLDRDGQPLDCSASGWQAKIPIAWKTAVVQKGFEEPQTLDDEDRKN